MKQKSLFINSIYKALLTIVNIVIPVFVGPYIARVLDVGLYGKYNSAYSDMQMFLAFACFGIYNFGVREIAKVRNNKEEVSRLFTSLFVISLISNGIILLIYSIYSFFISSSSLTFIIYLLCGIQIVANIFYIEFVNEAFENFKFITIKGIIIKILYFISLILFVKKADDIIPYTLIIGLTVLINNLISYIYIRKRITFNFKKIEIKKYISPLIMVMLITNMSLLYSQLDKVMLGHFVSEVAVTIYYIPYYILSTIASIPTAMVSVSIPRLGYIIKNEGKKEYESIINRIIKVYMFLILPICFGMFVLSKEIIIIYGSQKYLEAIIPFAVMSVFRVVLSVGSLFIHLVMYPCNEEKTYIKYAIACGCINVFLNSVLIFLGKLNPTTAFITTGICELILAFLQYIYITQKLKIKLVLFSKNTLKYLILSLIFVPISLLVHYIDLGFYWNIMIIILTCMILYVGYFGLTKDESFEYIWKKFFSKFMRGERK